MNETELLHKLVAIEMSVGMVSDTDILNKVVDAESCLLEMQRERLSTPFMPKSSAVQVIAVEDRSLLDRV